MKMLRSILVVMSLSAGTAFADLAPLPPPDYKDCTAEKQKKTPTDECQECNNIYQDGCEKQFKDQGMARACQIKPEYSSEWREVWCKAPAKAPEPAKEPAARAVTETTKQGGCAVDPTAGGSWLMLAAFAMFLRRKRKELR
jgi:MYXO-CTERM domain-containing protein